MNLLGLFSAGVVSQNCRSVSGIIIKPFTDAAIDSENQVRKTNDAKDPCLFCEVRPALQLHRLLYS